MSRSDLDNEPEVDFNFNCFSCSFDTIIDLRVSGVYISDELSVALIRNPINITIPIRERFV